MKPRPAEGRTPWKNPVLWNTRIVLIFYFMIHHVTFIRFISSMFCAYFIMCCAFLKHIVMICILFIIWQTVQWRVFKWKVHKTWWKKTKHLITQEVHHIMQCVTHNVERILRHGKCIPHSESYTTHNVNCTYNEKYITNKDTCASPHETWI